MVEPRTGAHTLELLHTRSLQTLLTLPFARGHEISCIACALLPTAELGFVVSYPKQEDTEAAALSDGPDVVPSNLLEVPARPPEEPSRVRDTLWETATDAHVMAVNDDIPERRDGDVVAALVVRAVDCKRCIVRPAHWHCAACTGPMLAAHSVHKYKYAARTQLC